MKFLCIKQKNLAVSAVFITFLVVLICVNNFNMEDWINEGTEGEKSHFCKA